MNGFRQYRLPAALLLALAAPPVLAQRVEIPPNADPGAIMNHSLQNEWRRQHEPWLGRPALPADVRPFEPEEPLIEYRNMEIRGNIIRPGSQPPVPPPP